MRRVSLLDLIGIALILAMLAGATGAHAAQPRTLSLPTSSTPNRTDAPASPVAASVQVTAGIAHTCAVTSSGGVKCWGDNSSGQLGDGTTTNRLTPADVTGLAGGVMALDAGGDHTCALTSAGGVKCWGWNGYGQLGDGTNTDRLTPVNVSGLTSGVTTITAGGYHTCALTATGSVKCWGWNIGGQLGDGTTTDRLTPVTVTGLASGVSAIDAGGSHTCAVLASGAAKCWGYNAGGQLGDGTRTTRLAPVDVKGLISGVSVITGGGAHTCAVTAAAVQCWGKNNVGQLGDGSTTDRLTRVDVIGLTGGVRAVSAGSDHTCVLMTNGGVKCWGSSLYGQLGNGATLGSSTPGEVAGMTSGMTSLAAGGLHTCAAQAAGSVRCWGANHKGQLGDGSITGRSRPAYVMGLWYGIVSIAAGGYHTCALSGIGGVRCWGNNNYGQLGNNTNINRTLPTPVTGLATGVIAIAAGDNHTCALTSAGGVKCWGENGSGQLGNNTTASSLTPVAVSGLSSGALAIVAGSLHTCALITNGVIKCWGSNVFGQLGDGTNTNRWTPVGVGLASMAADLAAGDNHTCAVLAASGGVQCWGLNHLGQLGDGTTTIRTLPTNVTGLNSSAANLAGGNNHTCALTTGGGLKCWGGNNYGQLGDGTTAQRLAPVDVAGFSSGAAAITAGWAHSCALTAAGAAYCWGSNSYGELGDGMSAHQPAPVAVVGLSSGVTTVAAGLSHTCALMASGQVLCWGMNNKGQLGDGTTTFRRSPVGVVALVTANGAITAGVAHSCAVTAVGGVQCWGVNRKGEVGDGTFMPRGTPVAVTGLNSGVISVAAGQHHTCALTVSGGVRCWGWNGNGQLGEGTTTDRPMPVDVTGLSSGVVAIAAGNTHSCALLNTGRVKCWGWNGYGQLGDGTTTDRWTPTDVSGLTNGMIAIAAGSAGTHTCAVTVSGGVKCWGFNLHGQLGDGTKTGRTTPVDVVGLASGVTAVSGGGLHTCALTAAGGAKCWGGNESGQLGDGTYTERLTPVDVIGLTSGVAAITGGYAHTCAVTNIGGAKCWGGNESGQLGDGTTSSRSTPVIVIGLTSGVIAIATGWNHTVALTVSGIFQTGSSSASAPNQSQSTVLGGGVKAWGANDQGQLGDGTLVNRSTPVAVIGLSGNGVALAAGEYHTCALTASGGVKCWGFNLHGQLGDGTATDRLTPVDVFGLTSGVIAITAGNNHVCALTASGGVKCWGWNAAGEIGDGTTAHRNTPVDVVGLTSGVAAITAGAAHSCAILAVGGGVKCWGRNLEGQLGDGTKTGRTTPVNVVGLAGGVIAVSGGGLHTCALTATGGVKCWGWNTTGQLGDGTTTDRLTPVDVSGLTGGAAAIDAGGHHTCTLTLSGGVQCWGWNYAGQLGDGTFRTIRLTPVTVSGLSGEVVRLSTGYAYSCAITDLGGAQCWGANSGQLGDGTTTSRLTPVGVSGLAGGAVALETGTNHTVALLEPGPASSTAQSAGGPASLLADNPRVLSWGANSYGQLGDGTTTDRLTPVEVRFRTWQKLFLPIVQR